MAEIAFDFGTPALGDLVDGGVNYNLGVRFTSSDTLDCVGVDWYVPATAPTGTCTVALWDVASEVRLAAKAVSFAGLGGTLVRTYFDTPVSVTAATEYTASVHTPNRYVATPNYTWPHTDGVLTAVANNGWLAFLVDPASGVNVFPNIESGNDGNFHMSPVLDDGEVEGPVDKDGADVGHLAEARTLERQTDRADSGRGADLSAGLAVTPNLSADPGHLGELAAVVVTLTASDAGHGAEARLSLAADLAGTDRAAGAENPGSVPATLTGLDVGHLLDVATLAVTGQLAVSGTDLAHLVELADLVVVGIDHGHITDRTVTRARARDVTATRTRALVRGLD